MLFEGPPDQNDDQFHQLAKNAKNFKSIRHLLLNKIRQEVKASITDKNKETGLKLSVIDPELRKSKMGVLLKKSLGARKTVRL